MTTSITPTTTLAHARARFLLVGFWVPFLALVGALVLQLMWLSELPNPAAIHFSGRGGPMASARHGRSPCSPALSVSAS